MLKRFLHSICFFMGLGAFSFQACSTPPHSHETVTKQDFDFKEIQRQLANEGLVVEVHSAVAQYGLYVATYRDRENFFNYVHMSMITRDQELKKVLSSLQRHDKIRITGKFADNDSPQKHIKLSNIEVLKKYEPTPGLPKHDYPENIPEELKAKNSARFLVHAVHADGKILVLEYKEMVVPIFVTRNELSRDLYRNDKIILNYVIQENPGRPTHLELDPNVENPIEVFDRIEDQNEKMATLQGELILFPKSPQVSFDVWALLQTDEFGIKTNYTIVNFEDMDKFKAIRDKMAAAWAKDPQNFVSGRNKLVHNKIEVKARGRLNVVDPNQANPQIMLDSADDLEIIVK